MYGDFLIKFTPTQGSTGSLIEYREASSAIWITPSAPANPTTLSEYPLAFTPGKTYYIAISSIGSSCSPKRKIITVAVPPTTTTTTTTTSSTTTTTTSTTSTTTTTTTTLPCCPPGFTLSPDRSFCYREETMQPEIITSGICLASSKEDGAYGWMGAQLYNHPVGINLPASDTFTPLRSAYWTGNPAGYADLTKPGRNPDESVMNRDSVWVDSDCNNVKDSLARCSVLQFTYLLNLPSSRRVHIGIGGDNTFRIDVNNQTLVQCEAGATGIGNPPCATAPAANGQPFTNVNFNIWHIIPVDLSAGPNYINFRATGDGSVNDALAAVIYNNTASQIANATSDSDLDIIFRTGDYKGSTIDIATCPDGWVLDTSGGSGNYVCRKITSVPTTFC